LCISTRRRPGAYGVWTARSGRAVEVLVEPLTDSRSRLTISVDFTGHGIGQILVPLMVRREARKEMPDNMAALKQRIEAS
jgi:hypothetical protein